MGLADVYDTYRQYYHIKDTKKIDLILSLILTKQLEGKRTWLLLIGESSIGKNMITEPICYLKDDEDQPIVRKISDMTSNTIVSGFASEDSDLAAYIDQKIIYFPDFSTLVEKRQESQRVIYSQLRNLYDGYARKDTGSPFESKEYDVDVGFIGNVTPGIYNKSVIHQEMGSRFIYYQIDDYTEKKVEQRALSGFDNKKIQQEIGEVLQVFLADKKPVAKYSEEMGNFIIRAARWTAEMRATGDFDSYDGSMTFPPYPEKPPRLIKQFRNIWFGLQGLKKDYPEQRGKQIIKKLAISSVDPLKYGIWQHIKQCQQYGKPLLQSEICQALKTNSKTVGRRLQELWYQEIINKETTSDLYGREQEGYVLGRKLSNLEI